MTRDDRTVSALQEAHLLVQAKLAAVWASFMFLYIYVDYLALYQPGFIGDLMIRVQDAWAHDEVAEQARRQADVGCRLHPAPCTQRS